ncbi:hypothetical protein L211DRAFT_833914 [Terfezia boudieri ATCC MYA-4762]|uniref:Uncharacterized protein n=1 Tax=Terfezia boudieri ATCC MYA-4762 TaxID=1051890 RepID=A0A3N4MGD5_9PEZI|nr:hypothetical protein L211DRAFT_833914 [Terfezia boudieri ATCC MYA-4762]
MGVNRVLFASNAGSEVCLGPDRYQYIPIVFTAACRESQRADCGRMAADTHELYDILLSMYLVWLTSLPFMLPGMVQRLEATYPSEFARRFI